MYEIITPLPLLNVKVLPLPNNNSSVRLVAAPILMYIIPSPCVLYNTSWVAVKKPYIFEMLALTKPANVLFTGAL